MTRKQLAMTRKQFRKRWESDADGGGITYEDIARCAIAWCVSQSPKTLPPPLVRYRVLKAAGTADCEEFNPANYNDDGE